MYELWYDYIKTKYQNSAKWCLHEYRQFFIINIKTKDFYEDIANDV